MRYTKWTHPTATPQSEPIPGSSQVPNHAGGFTWAIDDWARLQRFLILGSEGGTYYVGEKKLTRENAAAALRCIKLDGKRVVDLVVQISDEGRAPKNDPALFVLALAAKEGDEETRKAAFTAFPKVVRIGTHLFHIAQNIEDIGGWGRGTRRAFANWYGDMQADKLAMQVVKYQQRDGWSHRDIMRKVHPVTDPGSSHSTILNYAVKGWDGVGEAPHPNKDVQVIWAFERAKKADRKELIKLITDYHLPHECVPNEMKNDPKVWAAMLPNMGLTAMIRNLGKMTSVGLIGPMSKEARFVIDTLTDAEKLQKARVHPLQILVALKTYQSGHGVKGSLNWSPNGQISQALDSAFYMAFKTIEPTGKNTLLGLDVSASMDGSMIAGMPLSAREASAAMAMVTARTEKEHCFMAFSHQFVKLNIKASDSLDDVVLKMRHLDFGGTDCALPMLWALEKKVPVEAFVVYTDCETWAGSMHPAEALKQYRKKMGIPAKLVVVGMTATDVSIADPNDSGMMDVAGFDTAAPAVMADFIRK